YERGRYFKRFRTLPQASRSGQDITIRDWRVRSPSRDDRTRHAGGDQADSPDSFSVKVRYASASSRPSTAEMSVGSITIIHPSPYGSELTSCGSSTRRAFTSATVPLTGA